MRSGKRKGRKWESQDERKQEKQDKKLHNVA